MTIGDRIGAVTMAAERSASHLPRQGWCGHAQPVATHICRALTMPGRRGGVQHAMSRGHARSVWRRCNVLGLCGSNTRCVFDVACLLLRLLLFLYYRHVTCRPVSFRERDIIDRASLVGCVTSRLACRRLLG